MNGPPPREASRSKAHAELSITHQGGGLLMATFEHVCVAVWDVKPVRQLFEIQKAHLAAVVAREPQRALFMCVVASSADPPDQEIRDASAKMVTSHDKNLAGCCCVIEGTGFRAAITRTVLTGMMLVIRGPVPFHFSESVLAGCKWLETRGGRNRLQGLAAKIESARTITR
jgi:hypothetical protein